MKSYRILFLMMIWCSIVSAQTVNLLNRPHLFVSKQKQLREKGYNTLKQDINLIIGGDDPNERVTLTGYHYLHGDLIIVNNGVLNLDHADFYINGDVILMGNGALNVIGGDFTIVQDYIYEHQAICLENSKFILQNVSFQSSGQSWSIGLTDSSSYEMHSSEISRGFITVALLAESRARITDTGNAGEFLCFGDNSIDFKDCDLLLQWLVLPDSADVDVSLPDDSLVNYTFSDSLPNVNHIPYCVKMKNCSNVMWGLISENGSKAVFRDTGFRTIGLMFKQSDSVSVSNITNSSAHVNDVVNISDRTLHLIDCTVQTWSFYASGEVRLGVDNCVFGECLSQDSSSVTISNSVCDGTGGYLGAFNKSFTLVVGSLIRSQVISRENAVLVGAESAFLGSHIKADEASVMYLANTQNVVEPQALQAAIIFQAELFYQEGFVNAQVPLIGTAQILSGPDQTIKLEKYTVRYSESLNEPVWKETDGPHQSAVFDDTLCIWNTQGLDNGEYLLHLTLYHNFADSISMISYAGLSEPTRVDDSSGGSLAANRFNLEQNYPNPFNPVTRIRFSIAEPDFVILNVFNINGEHVAELVNRELQPGVHTVKFNGANMPNGIYFYKLQAGQKIHCKKMLLAK